MSDTNSTAGFPKVGSAGYPICESSIPHIGKPSRVSKKARDLIDSHGFAELMDYIAELERDGAGWKAIAESNAENLKQFSSCLEASEKEVRRLKSEWDKAINLYGETYAKLTATSITYNEVREENERLRLETARLDALETATDLKRDDDGWIAVFPDSQLMAVESLREAADIYLDPIIPPPNREPKPPPLPPTRDFA